MNYILFLEVDLGEQTCLSDILKEIGKQLEKDFKQGKIRSEDESNHDFTTFHEVTVGDKVRATLPYEFHFQTR
jgi:hypothetical protein